MKLDLETLELKVGAHSSPNDGMCVMEAVAYIAREPWSDHPVCVSPAIASFMRSCAASRIAMTAGSTCFRVLP